MDEGIIIFLGLIVCILIIYLWYWIAKQFYEVAVEKGYTDKKYLWIPFWFSVIGYLLVVALPDRKNISNNANTSRVVDDLPEL